ncbi:hypothetical protein [Thermospira aquatica]|uniref:Uncharacterized protein n=1 Tax=Thermospira aquatica TaxID=2828656 RepID=A0AAX3BBH7_9SPIR|nr:hypothetical protein [Thermospira aquatica]URA09662.1 hypothetical protein KDW03_09240 [Thermospira aquatica]
MNRLYEVKIKEKDGIATEIKWKRVEGVKVPGAYFIRTTLKGEDEETIWKIYNTLREDRDIQCFSQKTSIQRHTSMGVSLRIWL